MRSDEALTEATFPQIPGMKERFRLPWPKGETPGGGEM